MGGAPDDTICAIATPPGEGGIGIVRLSGPDSLLVADRVARLRSGTALSSVPSHTLHLADLLLPRTLHDVSCPDGQLLDEGYVVYMKAPRSFTAEDVVEIQSHGGAVVLSLLCRACLDAGARMAEPGEFTKRAFLNGRLDLSQAEAVLDTIRASSQAGLICAQRQLRGELRREVEQSRAGLITALAHVEAGIDFVEEDIAFLGRDELLQVIDEAASRIKRLASSIEVGRLLRDGAKVVIVGRPNVGKSSLMNRLLKEDRAIVTSIPGTTRDVLEESIDLQGMRVRLLDTAGIRTTSDPIEREGIKRTRSAQEDADLLLVVLDGSMPMDSEDRELLAAAQAKKHLVLLNKSDLPSRLRPDQERIAGDVLTISAHTGAGLEQVRAAIKSALFSPTMDPGETLLVMRARHASALHRASDSLEKARGSVCFGMAAELISVDLRAAAESLGEITGAITTEDVLTQVFSEFCIGK